MSTFIVQFVDETAETCRGRVRHVASGEESAFADERDLLAFFARMNTLGAMARINARLVETHRAGLTADDPAAGSARPEPPAPSSRRSRRHR